jgi:uncharacterized membrane protein (DUF485 family)
MEDEMKKDFDVDFRVGFNENIISESVNKAANMKYGALVIGIVEAGDYVSLANGTLDHIKSGKYF